MGCKYCNSGLGLKCDGESDDIHASCTCDCHEINQLESDFEDGEDDE